MGQISVEKMKVSRLPGQSPLFIMLMLEIWTGIRREVSFQALPAYKEAIEKAKRAGLVTVKEADGRWGVEGTEALNVYVAALKSIPLPVEKTVWVIPEESK